MNAIAPTLSGHGTALGKQPSLHPGSNATTLPPWHDALAAFKRRLLEYALASTGGNRTRAARLLGLQRTYLLRLIRELGVAAPPAPRNGKEAGGSLKGHATGDTGLCYDPPHLGGPRDE